MAGRSRILPHIGGNLPQDFNLLDLRDEVQENVKKRGQEGADPGDGGILDVT
jgi:hypothetical protein